MLRGMTGNWVGIALSAPLLVFAGYIVRQFVPWRKITIAADEKLRNDLLVRVGVLEDKLERKERQRIRAHNRHVAERAVDRHVLNNITQCFDAMLMLIEIAPDKTPEIVAQVKAMRAAQMLAEAQEKALIYAAEIAADDEEEASDTHTLAVEAHAPVAAFAE